MSSEARQWAFDRDIKPSSVKFVLVALGDIAQSDEVWPSIAALVQKTGQDRKTVMAALDRLESTGYLSDTKKRTGSTGQIKVYKFNFEQSNSTGNGIVKAAETAPDLDAKSTESGTVKEVETVPFFPETVPDFPVNSTVFPPKSTENGTRNPQEPTKEPLGNRKGKRDKSEAFVLPDWIPLKAWEGYLDMRKKKNKVPTERARDLVIKELGKLHSAGHDLETVLDNSTRNGWTDVWAPKSGQQARASPTDSKLGPAGQATAANAQRWLESQNEQ